MLEVVDRTAIATADAPRPLQPRKKTADDTVIRKVSVLDPFPCIENSYAEPQQVVIKYKPSHARVQREALAVLQCISSTDCGKSLIANDRDNIRKYSCYLYMMLQASC